MGTTQYLWSSVTDNVVEEFDDLGATQVSNTHLPELYGELVAQDDTETHFHHFDDRGSTVAITDEAGNVEDAFEYNAYGEEVAHTGASETPYRFQGAYGYYTDTELGSIYIRRRTYVPETGRWLSVDPLGDVDGVNLYRAYFVARWADPSGFRIGDWSGNLYNPDGSLYQLGECNDCARALEPGSFRLIHRGYPKTNKNLRRYVEFEFRIRRGADPEDCCLVNFAKGSIKRIGGTEFAKVRIAEVWVDANFDDWIIDTADKNPVYDSSDAKTWQYAAEGDRTWSADDRPSVSKGFTAAVDFQICIFSCADVPNDTKLISARSLLAKAIECKPWGFHASYRQDGTTSILPDEYR